MKETGSISTSTRTFFGMSVRASQSRMSFCTGT